MNINLATLNIKNIKVNQPYINFLCQTSNIICIQEHWLFDFELPTLSKYLPGYKIFARAVDQHNPISPIRKPRGYGGVAIAWKSEIDKWISILTDGNERLLAIRIKGGNLNLLLICVYMPARGAPDRDEEHLDVQQQIISLIDKHREPNIAVIVCGDFNATLTGAKQERRDKALLQTTRDIQVELHADFIPLPTFYHDNKKDSSCIDYILGNKQALNAMKSYVNLGKHPWNTSDHVAITSRIKINLEPTPVPKQVSDQDRLPAPRKPRWDKCDLDRYRETVEQALNQCHWTEMSVDDMDLIIPKVASIMTDSATKCCPTKRPRKAKNMKKRRMWNEQIKETMTKSKLSHWRWKEAGKPDKNHPLSKARVRAKRSLRTAQRRHEAEKRSKDLADIMHAQESDRNTFYRLIARQRGGSKSSATEMHTEEGLTSDPTLIGNAWVHHFKTLADPDSVEHECRSYHNDIEIDWQTISATALNNSLPPTYLETRRAVKSLNRGKACDVMGLTAEHILYGGYQILNIIHLIVTQLYEEGRVPEIMKLGLLTPVYKKGRPAREVTSYRGITVMPVLSKILEAIIKNRIERILDETQSPFQRGFTKGTSPINTALLLTETIQEYTIQKKPLYICLLDIKAAFDVVNHKALMRRLYLDGIQKTEWKLMNSALMDAKTQVKWDGHLSEPFAVKQGVRQGGGISTTQFKRTNDPLLHLLEDSDIGATIGTLSVSSPTCADDMALIASSPEELQTMMYVAEEYSIRERYNIQASKSAIIIVGDTKKTSFKWYMRGSEVPVMEEATHLGILRGYLNKPPIDDRIARGRKLVYSLMTVGLHGDNGLNPIASVKIIQVYVLPAMLHGLEAMVLAEKDIVKLENFYKRLLKQIQALPDRTADISVYLLLGVLPLEGIFHLKVLSLLGNICQNKSSLEYKIAVRQSLIRAFNDKSWFSQAKQILAKYRLPTLHDVLDSPLRKHQWKQTCTEAVWRYWTSRFRLQQEAFNTLRYMSSTNYDNKISHPVWKTVNTTTYDLRKAAVKVKLLTGTYRLQANQARYNQTAVDPTCPLCKNAPEDRAHFVANCPATQHIREKYLPKILQLVNSCQPSGRDLIQLILDSSEMHEVLGQEDLKSIERVSRHMCWALHKFRETKLAQLITTPVLN